MDDEDDDWEHKTNTVLLKRLFDQKSINVIEDAVRRTHDIVSIAYDLFKLDVLETLESISTAKWLSSPTTAFKDDIQKYVHAVSNEPLRDGQRRTGRQPSAEKQMVIDTAMELYDRHRVAERLPINKPSSANLSHVLSYTTTEMVSAFENNVQCHYIKYIKRLIAARWESKFGKVSGSAKKQRFAKIAKVAHHLMMNSTLDTAPCDDAEKEAFRKDENVMISLPRSQHTDFTIYSDLHRRPEHYFRRMVLMNRSLEDLGQPLYSPFPSRHDFIPRSIKISTQGLIDLLVPTDKESFAAFYLMLSEQIDLINRTTPLSLLKSKANLFKGAKGVIAEADLQAIGGNTPFNAACLFNRIWKTLTTLGSGKHPGVDQEMNGLVFNNMIDTNGYQASLHYATRAKYGMTVFNGGGRRGTAESATPFVSITDIESEEKDRLLSSAVHLVGADPGKDNIISTHDGDITFRYSSIQRQIEMRSIRNRKELERSLGLLVQTGPFKDRSVNHVQKQLQHVSVKSCFMSGFGTYLQVRRMTLQDMQSFYRRVSHRRRRFRSYCGKKSTEDKFIRRLKAAHHFDGKETVLLYGNWGRHPNMRYSTPSPGIGLRKVIHKRAFRTITTPEHYTSSVCPSCERDDLTHPTRAFTEGNCVYERPVHQLLICNSSICGTRYWKRDDLGSLNILKKGRHYLAEGVQHPSFRRRI